MSSLFNLLSVSIPRHQVFAFLIFSLLSFGASAQVGVDKSPTELFGLEQLERETQTEQLAPEVGELPAVPEVPKQLSKPLEELKVDVTGYQLTGYDDFNSAELMSLLETYVGEGRSFEDLSNAASVVSRYLQTELGLYLAYAYIPAQTLQDGLVEIRILPGYLDQVQIQWPEEELYVDQEVILAHLNHLIPGTLIKVAQVERVVFLLNDLRGIEIDFEIKPGLKSGTATLVAKPKNGERYEAQIGLDNQGSRFSGANRVSTTLQLNSPFGLGDAITFSHLRSATGGGLRFNLLGYTMPIGAEGFKLGVNVSQVDYRLKSVGQTLGLNGDSTSVSAFGLYPLIRSRNLNLFSIFELEHREYSDQDQVTPSLTRRRDVRLSKLSLSGDGRDSWFGGGISVARLGVSQASISYREGARLQADDASKGVKWEWEYSRLQNLIPRHLLLWASARGQFALDNLDPVEQCSIGGFRNVRAFVQGAGNGDSCQLYTVELRYLTQLPGFTGGQYSMSLAAFYDVGRVEYRHQPQNVSLNSILSEQVAATGLAVNWKFGPVALLQLVLAEPIGQIRREADAKQVRRLSASFQYRF